MLSVSADPVLVERALVSGGLACPGLRALAGAVGACGAAVRA